MPAYVIFLLAIAVVIGLVILVRWLAARKRRDDMARLAARLGYEFLPRADWCVPDGLRSSRLFQNDHGRTAQNLILGQRDGLELRLFDYSSGACTGPGNTNEARILDRSVVLVDVPGASFPSFMLRLEGVVDKIKAAAGFEDIDFESDEFSRRYYVTCSEKRFAYDFITAKQMELLLSVEDMNIEAVGCSLFFYLGSILATRELEWLHGFALEFVTNIPDFVLAGRGAAPA